MALHLERGEAKKGRDNVVAEVEKLRLSRHTAAVSISSIDGFRLCICSNVNREDPESQCEVPYVRCALGGRRRSVRGAERWYFSCTHVRWGTVFGLKAVSIEETSIDEFFIEDLFFGLNTCLTPRKAYFC
jgi:hypothetical protein